jgi:DNA mismatch repair ATPase MutS
MDLIIFLISIKEIRAEQKSLIAMYENIASLDCSISIASYLNSESPYCKPSFNGKNLMEATDLFHPLMKSPVANSFLMKNRSCLITGSNMAGKTTFMKTIGVNILLGRTLNICLAGSANLPMVEVKTSIKRQDDLEDNKSYYYKEIESILEFIILSKNGGKYLFLVDEIFRGTNTVERLSSAAAVLNYLCKKNITMVTTHDLELQEFVDEKFEMYHFMEQVENGVHFFDYIIKPGPCTSRNAIKLLEIKGYPEIIVKDALRLLKKLSSKA